MTALRKRGCDCAACRERDARDFQAIVAANIPLASHLYRVAYAVTPEEIVECAAVGRVRRPYDWAMEGPA